MVAAVMEAGVMVAAERVEAAMGMRCGEGGRREACEAGRAQPRGRVVEAKAAEMECKEAVVARAVFARAQVTAAGTALAPCMRCERSCRTGCARWRWRWVA